MKLALRRGCGGAPVCGCGCERERNPNRSPVGVLAGVQANLFRGFDLEHPAIVHGDLNHPESELLQLVLHNLDWVNCVFGDGARQFVLFGYGAAKVN
jgi:hypothetical protein